MKHDGFYLGRELDRSTLHMYDGEVHETTTFIWPEEETDKTDWEDENLKRLTALGKTYWNLLNKQCQYHKGKATGFPHNMVSPPHLPRVVEPLRLLTQTRLMAWS